MVAITLIMAGDIVAGMVVTWGEAVLVKPSLAGVDIASTTTGYQEISLITSMTRVTSVIRERVARGEVQANTTSTAPTPSVAPDSSVTHSPTVPVSQIHGPGAPSTPDTPSVITGVSTSASPTPFHSVSMSLITLSPHPPGATTSTQMDLGPNTLLHQ